MREPTLTIEPAEQGGIDLEIEIDIRPTLAFSAALSRSTWASERLRRRHFGCDFAARLGGELAEGLDHAGDGEEAAILGDDAQEIERRGR